MSSQDCVSLNAVSFKIIYSIEN